MKIVRREDEKDIDWSNFKFMVFDLPKHPGSYIERYKALGMLSFIYGIVSEFFPYIESILSANSASQYIKLAPKETCNGVRHLESYFQDIIARGGEGIILRDPISLYEPGRSPGYLKHKVGKPLSRNIFRIVLSYPSLYRNFVMLKPES